MAVRCISGLHGGDPEFLFLITAHYQYSVDELAKQQRIQELAHEIWEAEGRPDGHASRHWAMAERLVEAEIRVAEQRVGGIASAPGSDKET